MTTEITTVDGFSNAMNLDFAQSLSSGLESLGVDWPVVTRLQEWAAERGYEVDRQTCFDVISQFIEAPKTLRAKVRLMNEGMTGPSMTIDTTLETAEKDAIAWAESQVGHPWELITVCIWTDETETQILETIEIEFRDGAWETI